MYRYNTIQYKHLQHPAKAYYTQLTLTTPQEHFPHPTNTYRCEMLLRVLIGLPQQVTTRVRIRKRPNPETVRRVELLLEEVTADVLYLGELQQTGGGQKRLHVALLDNDRRRIAEVEEQFHRVLVDVPYRYFRLPTLG